MKKRQLDPVVLCVIPIVAFLMILYSGIMQKILPAVSFSDTSMTAVELNYYYYSIYNEKIEDEQWLEENQFQPEESEAKQAYNEEMTWREWFQDEAKKRAAEVIYYTDLAEEQGYTYQNTEARLNEKKEEIEAFCKVNGINKAGSYLEAYYGNGMTEKVYYKEYKLECEAAEFKEWLGDHYEATTEEKEACDLKPDEAEYLTANVEYIVLDAAIDRSTGNVEEQQLLWLQAKLEQLEKIWKQGESSFEELYQLYSEETVGTDGYLENATHSVLPEELDQWIYATDTRTEGDFTAVLSKQEQKAYLAVFLGWGTSGTQMEYEQLEREEILAEKYEQAMEDTYMPRIHKTGMFFVGV